MNKATDFSNVVIGFKQPRGGLKTRKDCKLMLGGQAPHGLGECYPIVMMYVEIGPKDEVEELSAEDIIVHETVHHLVSEIMGGYASFCLDSMIQERTMIDSDRVYIQKNKVVL